MLMLRIYLFGSLRIEDDAATPLNLGRGAATLLAYLAVHGDRLHSREVLADTFWPDLDQDASRRCLNTTLWRLRRILEPHGVPRGTFLATTARGELGLVVSGPLWIDVREFERAVVCHTAASSDQAALFDRGLRLYCGDVLEGHYQEWALKARERLRSVYVDAVQRRMRELKGEGNLSAAIVLGERILNLDPLREDVHQEIIRLHLMSGNRSLAIKQLELCERTLRDELSLSPMASTRCLLDRDPSSCDGHRETCDLRSLIKEMRRLLDLAEAAVATM